MKDHDRAQHAYERVRDLAEAERADYKVAVNALGPNVVRSGLAAAIAFLERRKDNAAKTLLGDLATSRISGLEHGTAADFGDRIRRLETKEYMLATRDFMRVALWFKRAVQAGFGT
jgi:CRISPR-associated protein Cmr5